MSDSEIEIYFRRKGFKEKALRLAKTFIDPHAKAEMSKFTQKLNSFQTISEADAQEMENELREQEEESDEIEQVAS